MILIFNGPTRNSHLDRGMFFNSSKIITFNFFPQSDRFSFTLLVFLIAFDFLFKFIILPYYAISTSFRLTGCGEQKLFLREGA
jgi:hypothetical protein